MTVASIVRERLNSMTPRERRVAQVLIARYPTAGLETVARLARKADVSGATVLRFVARLGFPGYPGFQRALREEIDAGHVSPLSQYEAHRGYGHDDAYINQFFQAASRNLSAMCGAIDPEDFQQVTKWLADGSRPIYIIGGRFSQFLAEYVAWHLRQLRPGVHIVDGQSQAWAGRLIDIDRRTVVLAFDFRRYQSDVVNFSIEAAQQGAKVVLITDNWLSPIAGAAHSVWCCPIEVPSPYDSALAGLALGECLVGAVVQAGGEAMRRRVQRIDELSGAVMALR